MGTLVYLYATVSLPDEPPQIQSSIVLDAQGRELAVLQKDELRVEVELDDVAPVVVQALIAAEDRSFRSHDGVDPRALVRALRNNAEGGATQGGSTITQQLVKNTYLTSERSYSRKVKEAVLAIKLDQRTDKDEILERYLNTVYFGRGTYGIQAAADTYFDKPAKDLDAPQAALLIGLLRAPENADPETDPDVAKERRDQVLDDLVDVGDLTAEEGRRFKAAELGAVPRQSSVTLRAGVGAHVVEWVRQEAIAKFGEEAVYGQGLTIRTTIDIDQQRAAEEAVASVLTEPGEPQAALVAIDAFGAVKAHVGGRNFEELEVDLARGEAGGGSGRQPGSAFKPVVLATAIQDRKATLASTYPAPAEITLDTGGEPWTVGNYGGSGFGVTDLTDATANSINTTYAQLMLQVGPDRAVTTAASLGIASELRPDPSLVLGTGEVSVVELASAYSTFAREGRRIEPFVISKVLDADEQVLFEAKPSPQEAIDEGTARAVNHALQAVVADGTGAAARLDRPVAGKTGTTQDNGDAWFAGYTPNFTAAVWMGYPEGPQRPMTDVKGEAVTGGSLPAEIWRRFMERALVDVDPGEFAPPPPELLEPLDLPETSLEVSPTVATPGATVTVTGSGFTPCSVDWLVRLEPGGVASAGQPGSTSNERQTTVVVPPDAIGGPATVTALCDRGTGPEPAGEATLEIDGPDPTTTTSSSTTTSSTTTTPDTVPQPTQPPAGGTVAPTQPPGTAPGRPPTTLELGTTTTAPG
ncbi:MAG TPA: transglycosylase domain-containing protein [Aquihabitans sp.]|nr:transglycosylase domain-containing protein [Aquihabitans sp.]